LMFYREEMARDVPGKDYPYGIECESEARAAVAKAGGRRNEYTDMRGVWRRCV
jgi:hypothetical protein